MGEDQEAAETPRLLSRRKLLIGATVLGAGAAAGGAVLRALSDADPQQEATAPAPTTPRPSHPDHASPSAGPSASPAADVDRVLADGERFPDGFTVPAGEVWQVGGTVESSGNVVVRGTLRMHPGATLRFVDVDESRYVGGGMEILDSDVGLWIVEDGILEAQGTPRAGWNRTGTDPSWQPGHEIRSAPIDSGDFQTFAPFEPGSPVPEVSFEGRTLSTEVFNLTRDVVIEGTPERRAHVIFLAARRPQSIGHILLRHLGPRQGEEEVLGRYPLHFHHCHDGVRGSTIEGVVVRESGNRAFVPHASNGMTFRDCIAFDVQEDAYWWDPDDDENDVDNSSHDTLYEHCAVFGMRPTTGPSQFIQAGFQLGQGTENSCIDCVVVGNRGEGPSSSGFTWPEHANYTPNLWVFQDCVAHNNHANGIFVWQNDENPHVTEQFIAYRNGIAGIDHGAYLNLYLYRDIGLYGNREAGIRSHAQSAGPDEPLRWESVVMHGGGSAACLLIRGHALPAEGPNRLIGCTMRGWGRGPVVVDSDEEVGLYEFIRTDVDGRDLEPEDFVFDAVAEGSRFRVQRMDGTAFELDGSSGVRVIPAFAS